MERHASKTAEAKTDRRGQSKWEDGWCEKIQPQMSQRRQPARTTEDDGQMKEAALLSLSSHSVLLSVSRQHAHPPVPLTALHCTARTSGCLDRLRGIWWPLWELVATLSVESKQRDWALYGPACAFHPIGCLWLVPSVCTRLCVNNKASCDFYRNTGCFVECVSHW